MLQVFYLFLDVCCKCFYLDIAKIDLSVSHITVEPICSSDLPACIRMGVEWVPRCTRRPVEHGAAQAPT